MSNQTIEKDSQSKQIETSLKEMKHALDCISVISVIGAGFGFLLIIFGSFIFVMGNMYKKEKSQPKIQELRYNPNNTPANDTTLYLTIRLTTNQVRQ